MNQPQKVDLNFAMDPTATNVARHMAGMLCDLSDSDRETLKLSMMASGATDDLNRLQRGLMFIGFSVVDAMQRSLHEFKQERHRFN